MAEIVALPLNGYAPNNEAIAQSLRQMASEFENGDWGDVRTVILVIEGEDGRLVRATIGQSCDICRVAGLLSMMATRIAVDG